MGLVSKVTQFAAITGLALAVAGNSGCATTQSAQLIDSETIDDCVNAADNLQKQLKYLTAVLIQNYDVLEIHSYWEKDKSLGTEESYSRYFHIGNKLYHLRYTINNELSGKNLLTIAMRDDVTGFGISFRDIDADGLRYESVKVFSSLWLNQQLSDSIEEGIPFNIYFDNYGLPFEERETTSFNPTPGSLSKDERPLTPITMRRFIHMYQEQVDRILSSHELDQPGKMEIRKLRYNVERKEGITAIIYSGEVK